MSFNLLLLFDEYRATFRLLLFVFLFVCKIHVDRLFSHVCEKGRRKKGSMDDATFQEMLTLYFIHFACFAKHFRILFMQFSNIIRLVILNSISHFIPPSIPIILGSCIVCFAVFNFFSCLFNSFKWNRLFGMEHDRNDQPNHHFVWYFANDFLVHDVLIIHSKAS